MDMKSDGRSPFAKTFFLISLPLFLLFSIVAAVFFSGNAVAEVAVEV